MGETLTGFEQITAREVRMIAEVVLYKLRCPVRGIVVHNQNLHPVRDGQAQMLKAVNYVFLPVIGADNR